MSKSGTVQKSNFANGFLNIIDRKYTGFNPFKKFISRIKFNAKCRKIANTSPSFGQLWSFADFVKIAEEVFFFHNNSKGRLYSSRSFKAGENGFVINSEADHVNIITKLYSDTQSIVLEVHHTNGSNLTSTLYFRMNEWDTDHSSKDTDIILLDNVIGIINRYIVFLLRYCYNRRGSEDYERTISDSEF